MKAKNQHLFLLLLCCFFVSSQTLAQQQEAYDTLGLEQRKIIAENAIKSLKEGVLVVRLTTNKAKIEVLEKLANDTFQSHDNRKKYRQQIEEAKEEALSSKRILATAFLEKYDFSEVIFMADTLAPTLKDGKTKGIFLNHDLQPDPSIGIGPKPFFVAYFGVPSYSKTSTAEGISIVDHQLKAIEPPFPSFAGNNTLKIALKKIFGNNSDQENISKVVEKLNARLHKYFGELGN